MAEAAALRTPKAARRRGEGEQERKKRSRARPGPSLSLSPLRTRADKGDGGSERAARESVCESAGSGSAWTPWWGEDKDTKEGRRRPLRLLLRVSHMG